LLKWLTTFYVIDLRSKWLATWQTVIVPEGVKDPDRHENPGVLARPSKQLRDQARGILKANGWTMNDFLVACLVLLTRNPTAMLDRLKEFRPPAKKGRPRKPLRA
jgi:hypothetical protein